MWSLELNCLIIYLFLFPCLNVLYCIRAETRRRRYFIFSFISYDIIHFITKLIVWIKDNMIIKLNDKIIKIK